MDDSSNKSEHKSAHKPAEQDCECGSGLAYDQCCGVEGRNALTADVYAYVSKKGVTSEDVLTLQMQAAIDSIADNPQLFPARVNLFTDKAWYIKMSPATYRDSVFLDPSRMKGTCLVESRLDWLKQVCEKIKWQPTAYIFHSAFCGSTLMTQILDSVFSCLSLREPELLNSILVYQRSDASDEEKALWNDNLLKLLSRRFSVDQPVVVKANDFANPLMSHIRHWRNDVPILFMYTPVKEFIVACLKSEERINWIRQRYEVVKAFIPPTFKLEDDFEIDESDSGQLAAVYWSYNLAMYLNVSGRDSKNIKSLDFNDMLANPHETIKQCGELFGLKVKEDIDFDSTVAEIMGVYSKNSDFKYSPEQRQKDLEKQLAEFKNELESGEKVARTLLGDNYSKEGLPNNLLDA